MILVKVLSITLDGAIIRILNQILVLAFQHRLTWVVVNISISQLIRPIMLVHLLIL